MKLKYLGHSAFLLEGNGIKALLDPFIKGNPQAPVKLNELQGITHIFVTHGHGDHLGDTLEIAARDGSLVITNFELGNYLERKGLKVHTMHIGGRTEFDFGRIKMTPALHGSGIMEDAQVLEGGNPCGFVIELEGKKIYHAGDTGLTMDLQLLAAEDIQVALLPIGGNYTMDIADAVRAVDFIKPQLVVPMHYNTFPPIQADPREFAQQVQGVEVRILEPGEELEL